MRSLGSERVHGKEDATERLSQRDLSLAAFGHRHLNLHWWALSPRLTGRRRLETPARWRQGFPAGDNSQDNPGGEQRGRGAFLP